MAKRIVFRFADLDTSGAELKPEEVQFANTLEALKSPQCRRLVKALFAQAASAAELAAFCKLSPGSVEKHLDILQAAGLVRVKPEQSTTSYSLDHSAFEPARGWFQELAG